MEKVHKILIATHDAGGAQILASLMKKYLKCFDWFAFVAGPAMGIFAREGLPYKASKNIGSTLHALKPDLVLTGTGWASHLELDFIKEAKKAGIKSAAYLDHWCNYRERFGYPGPWQENLPDFVFVGDKEAHKLALKNYFGEGLLRQVENPCWQDIHRKIALRREKYSKQKSSRKIKVLYLSSPITVHTKQMHGDERYWGFTEYDQIEDLLDVVKNDPRLELRVRLHPAEANDKYDCLKLAFVSFSDPRKTDLVEDCLQADIIIGCDSMALVAAWMTGHMAINYFKGEKLKPVLPQKGIIRVFSKTALAKKIKMFQKKDESPCLSLDFFTFEFPKVLGQLN